MAACVVAGPIAGAEPTVREAPASTAATVRVAGPDAKAAWTHRGFVSWYRLESGPVEFGDVLPGEPAEIPGAIRARVFAETAWSLSLVARTDLRATDGGGASPPRARLSCRTEHIGDYLPVDAGGGVVVAAGPPTGPGGRLVAVDLRMALADTDDLGSYESRLELVLDTRSAGSGFQRQPSTQRTGEK